MHGGQGLHRNEASRPWGQFARGPPYLLFLPHTGGFCPDGTKGCSTEQAPLFTLKSVCFKREGYGQGLRATVLGVNSIQRGCKHVFAPLRKARRKLSIKEGSVRLTKRQILSSKGCIPRSQPSLRGSKTDSMAAHQDMRRLREVLSWSKMPPKA